MTGASVSVSAQYTTGGLLERIRAGLQRAGIDPDRAGFEDLKPIDEFHIGGAEATEALLAQAPPEAGMAMLDIGSGIGGTARLIAGRKGCDVTGLDLTEEFVATATALTEAAGLSDRVRFRVGSALDMPFADDSFDAASMLHVGMNIADKHGLMAEAARVLRPGGHFLVYEVMRTGEGALKFPLPWSGTPETSWVGAPQDYRDAARATGFEIVTERERRDYALDFFARMQARMAEGAPPLGPHLIVGESYGEKIANMVTNIRAGLIAPVELILRLP